MMMKQQEGGPDKYTSIDNGTVIFRMDDEHHDKQK